MRFAEKTVILLVVACTCVLNATITNAVTFEVFQCTVSPKKSGKGPKARQATDCGIYLTDVMTSGNFEDISREMANFETILRSEGLSNGIDYYYSGSFLYYLPQSSSTQARNISHGIATLKDALSGYKVVPKIKKNIKPGSYVRTFSAKLPAAATVEDMLGPLKLNLPDKQMAELNSLAELHQRLQAQKSEKKGLETQLKLVKSKTREISALLKGYKGFDQLYDELQQLREKMRDVLSDPYKKCCFKDMIRFLVTGTYGWDFFASDSQLVKSFSNKKVTYNQLNDLANIFSQKSTNTGSKDESLIMLKKYLQLVNVIFLNKNNLPELSKICNDPYNEVSILSLNDYSATSTLNETRFSGTYSFAKMVVFLGEYSMSFDNLKGKNAMISFDKSSSIADLNKLKDITPLLKSALADVIANISETDLSLKEISKGSSISDESSKKFLRHYWVISNLNHCSGSNGIAPYADDTEASPFEKTIDNRHLIADILFNYGEDVWDLIASDMQDINASLSHLRSKMGKRERSCNVFPSHDKWVVIGKYK